MDAQEINRYSELVAGFTPDEIKELPLAIEVYPTLPELIEAMVSEEAGYASRINLGPIATLFDSLNASVALEAEAQRGRSFLDSIWKSRHVARVDRLRYRSGEIYEEIVREYSFIRASFELQTLIGSAYRNELSSLIGGSGDSFLSAAIRDNQLKLSEMIADGDRLTMKRLAHSFRLMELRYDLELRELRLQDLIMSEPRYSY